jgi:hypothetical protein
MTTATLTPTRTRRYVEETRSAVFPVGDLTLEVNKGKSKAVPTEMVVSQKMINGKPYGNVRVGLNVERYDRAGELIRTSTPPNSFDAEFAYDLTKTFAPESVDAITILAVQARAAYALIDWDTVEVRA